MRSRAGFQPRIGRSRSSPAVARATAAEYQSAIAAAGLAGPVPPPAPHLDERSRPPLTVDYRRFPVRPGHRVLDLGCGGGRHAFEAYRRGAALAEIARLRPDPARSRPDPDGVALASAPAAVADPGDGQSQPRTQACHVLFG